jgi:hypothetical protein
MNRQEARRLLAALLPLAVGGGLLACLGGPVARARPGVAGEPPILVRAARFWAAPRRLVVQGQVGFVTSGDAVAILDLTQPSAPRLTSFTDAAFREVVDVAADGTWLYVLDAAGLGVVDVADPRHPRVVGQLALPGTPRRVLARGPTVIVALGARGGVRLVDVGDPAAPREVGHVDTPGDCLDLALQGRALYVADGPLGLMTIDVEVPERPRLLGSTPSGVTAQRVAAGLEWLIVLDGLRLRRFDTGDPFSPVEVSGAVLQAGDVVRDLLAAENRLVLLIDRANIRVLRYFHDSAVLALSHDQSVDPGALALGWGNGHLVVAHQSGDYALGLTLTVPAGTQRFVELARAPRVLVANDRYACSGSPYVRLNEKGLLVLCLRSDGAGPVRVAAMAHLAGVAENKFVPLMAFVGDRLYVLRTDGAEGDGPSLYAIDLAAGSAALSLPLAGLDLDGAPQLLASAGDWLYVIGGTAPNAANLWVIDVSLPWRPEVRGSTSFGGTNFAGLAVTDGLGFAVGNDLVTLDLSSSNAPRFVGRGKACGTDVTLVGDFVYLACGWVDALTAGDPANPLLIGRATGAENVLSFARYRDQLLIVGGLNGLGWVDVTEPRSPRFLGGVPGITSGNKFTRVRTAGDTIFALHPAPDCPDNCLWAYSPLSDPPVPTASATVTVPASTPRPPSPTATDEPTVGATGTVGVDPTAPPTGTPTTAPRTVWRAYLPLLLRPALGW